MQKYKKKARYEEYEEEDILQEDNDNIHIIEKSTHTEYILFLDHILANEKDFRKFYIICEKASEDDIIRLILNCSGGKLGILSQLSNCILNTEAMTIAEIYVAYSAASLFALLCDEIYPMKYSMMMLHSIKSEIDGNVFEMEKELFSLNKRNENIIKDIVKNFLSEEEIKRVLKGEEFWFNEHEIKERLENWVPYRERKK